MKNLATSPLLLVILVVLFFFKPFFLESKLPIPADTIVGLYHPYRDLYAKEYPRGIPFKNFLITDSVRQQFPWRKLSVDTLKKMQLPLWNPYVLGGTPLLGNFQSGALYPLNILFFVLSFELAWSLLVILQPLLAACFMYLFLKELKLNPWACALGALSYAFSGFFVAWLEWNTILHVALWLPLLLLAKEKLLKKLSVFWIFVFLIAESSAVFAGHLQTYFYFILVSNAYLFARIFQLSLKEKKKSIVRTILNRITPFLLLGGVVLVITVVQWYPAMRFIAASARNIDIGNFQQEGWFIPWQHLVQFVAPDFFGNPTTLNYWGAWNYGELVGYIGIIPLIMALFALFFRKDKKTLFFGTLFFISLLFALPSFISQLPYVLKIPFLSTAQPTRLLFVVDFSLAVLAAFGLDHFLRNRRGIFYPLLILGITFFCSWVFIFYGKTLFPFLSAENILVTKNNLILPTLLFIISSIAIIVYSQRNFSPKYTVLFAVALFLITSFDLVRFAVKFTPFASSAYLYPQTKVISFLQNEKEPFRIMTTDSRIFPPNFSSVYKIQTVDGYDPLYLRRYGELIAASERGKPDISSPFGFNRIITPHNYDSKIMDLLGVKYVLSLTDLNSPKLRKVFQEGQTQVYENKNVLPRAYFVKEVITKYSKEDVIKTLFTKDFDLQSQAIIESPQGSGSISSANLTVGQAKIIHYSENKVIITVENEKDGFLVLTDAFYPTWRAKVDSEEVLIERTNYHFRGIRVPSGSHIITFYNTLL